MRYCSMYTGVSDVLHIVLATAHIAGCACLGGGGGRGYNLDKVVKQQSVDTCKSLPAQMLQPIASATRPDNSQINLFSPKG